MALSTHVRFIGIHPMRVFSFVSFDFPEDLAQTADTCHLFAGGRKVAANYTRKVLVDLKCVVEDVSNFTTRILDCHHFLRVIESFPMRSSALMSRDT